MSSLRSASLAASFLLALGSVASTAYAQLDFEKPPINYGETAANDPVAQLAARIEEGSANLTFDERHGWLPSLLENLAIDPNSQVLVFSKTSLQLHKISPRTPRALYFNDDIYVGWCVNGDVLEIAATDPQQGAIFYTLDQHDPLAPQITADRGQCLTCHATNRTQGVPGYLVRSVFPDFNGRPRSGTRTYVTDHTSDFEERYGGWYVTGSHGTLRHMGNQIAEDRSDPELIQRDEGANRSDLSDLFDTSPYLASGSDIVALMLLEHQSQMHNLLARASMETRSAMHYDRGINEALGRPIDTISETTQRRIARAGEDVVKYMLFANERALPCPVEGNAAYAEQFEKRAIPLNQVDSRGRSLRQLDLNQRLFRYPCSYLIYSTAFDELPQEVHQYIVRRLHEILSAQDTTEGFEHLTQADRSGILEILSETKPKLFAEVTEQ